MLTNIQAEIDRLETLDRTATETDRRIVEARALIENIITDCQKLRASVRNLRRTLGG